MQLYRKTHILSTNDTLAAPMHRNPYLQQPSTRARSPRTACNFCHDKRVKCVMIEGETRCEQCAQRNTNCIFSVKVRRTPPYARKRVSLLSRRTHTETQSMCKQAFLQGLHISGQSGRSKKKQTGSNSRARHQCEQHNVGAPP